MRQIRNLAAACAAGMLLGVFTAGAAAAAGKPDKMPITTTSDEARKLYLEARDLGDKLRATDAHKKYEEALAKDPDFALAHLGKAFSSATGQEFFDEVQKAVALSDKVSEGERIWLLAADAGARGDNAKQKAQLVKLVATFPKDERAHALLGNFLFGQQQWAASIDEHKKAIKIAPDFSQPYNQLGYAYRFSGKMNEAEEAFKKYIEVLPSDPNPHDSYAELLMKLGRFDESIKQYEQALAIDPNFIASYIGIGNDQMFMGKLDDARKSFAKLASVARNDGEKRAANFWTATSYLYEGKLDKALAEMEKNAAIAKASGDLTSLSADHNTMGDMLLESGRLDEAEARYKQQLETVDQAKVPDEVKAAVHRNAAYDQARLALARKDLAAAKSITKEYAKQVAVKKIPFEVFQVNELAGRIAMAMGRHGAAVASFNKANQQDPRALYLLALAYQGAGNAKKARETAERAANFNGLSPNYVYVRAKAKELLSTGG